MSNLFTDDRPEVWSRDYMEDDLSGLTITVAEITRPINTSKDKKTVGQDQVLVEMLKMLDINGNLILKKFSMKFTTKETFLLNDLHLTSFPCLKKKQATKCEDHRLINLMSHILKIFLNLIHYRAFSQKAKELLDPPNLD